MAFLRLRGAPGRRGRRARGDAPGRHPRGLGHHAAQGRRRGRGRRVQRGGAPARSRQLRREPRRLVVGDQHRRGGLRLLPAAWCRPRPRGPSLRRRRRRRRSPGGRAVPGPGRRGRGGHREPDPRAGLRGGRPGRRGRSRRAPDRPLRRRGRGRRGPGGECDPGGDGRGGPGRRRGPGEWLVPPELLESGQVAADLVYAPRPTRWLAVAAEGGATVLDGLGMLVHQAAAQIVLWTGREPPVEAMWDAAAAASPSDA